MSGMRSLLFFWGGFPALRGNRMQIEEEESMSIEITTTGVHHIRPIVTDPVRSGDFYILLLNFQVEMELSLGFC